MPPAARRPGPSSNLVWARSRDVATRAQRRRRGRRPLVAAFAPGKGSRLSLTTRQKALLRELAAVSVAAAGAGFGAGGVVAAAGGAAASQAFNNWLARSERQGAHEPDVVELLRKMRHSLQQWAEGELGQTGGVEMTAGLELAVSAVETTGFGWTGLAEADLDPSRMAQLVVTAAKRTDHEWAVSEQARFVIAERAIGMAADALARCAEENEPLLRATRDILRGEIDDVRRRVGAMEERSLPPIVRREVVLDAARRARSDLVPETLPAVDRSSLIRGGLDRLVEELTPFVVIGDGGLGKSVVAGQIYDTLLAETHTVVLMPCSAVLRTSSLESTQEVEEALCQAATGLDDVPPLGDVLGALASEGTLAVIIDTLDLILNDRSASAVGKVLGRLARDHELVVLCREREWDDFALSRFLPTSTVLKLPRLSSTEIFAWGQAFAADAAVENAAFLPSLNAAAKHAGGSDVLGVPLRLAMACELYAGNEVIPDDLTVPSLYRTYWHRRIALDREGFRGQTARAQEAAALSVAEAIWEESTERFVESARPTGPVDWAPLDRLRGEGVLRESNGRFRFFHQTFGEFAVARHLIAAADPEDLDRLQRRLRQNDSGMWGVAAYLLPSDLDAGRYDLLSASIPAELGRGMRILLRGAVEQQDDARCLQLVQRLVERAPEEVALYPEFFTSAQDSRRLPLAGVLLGLIVTQTRHLNRMADVAAALTKTLTPEDRASALFPAISSLLDRKPRLDSNVLNPVITRLLSGFPEVLPPTDEGLLVDLYEVLPGSGRALLFDRFQNASDEAVHALILTAMNHELPEGAAGTGGHLLARACKDERWRTARGWPGWRQLLFALLPTRWDAAQIRTVVELADEDDAVFYELLHEALKPQEMELRPRVHNAAEFLATEWPEKTSAAVLRTGIPANRMAVATVSTLFRRARDVVSPDTRRALARLLWERRSVDPKTALPALVRLMAADEQVHRELISELRRSFEGGQEDRARLNCFDAMLQTFSPAGLAADLELAELLSSGVHPNDHVNAAALQGFLAPASDRARHRCRALLLEGRRTTAVTACARKILESLAEWDEEELDSFGMDWLVGLLACLVPKAVEHIAEAISSRISSARWDRRMTQHVVDRIVVSLNRHEDTQVVDKLRFVLMGVARRSSAAQEIEAMHVRLVLDASWSALEEDVARGGRRAPALWAGINTTASALALKHFDSREMDELVGRIATTDSEAYSNRSTRYTSQTLTAYLERDPSRLTRLEALWDDMPALAQAAVAEALDRGFVPGKEGVAQRLLDRRMEDDTAARLLSIVENGGSRTSNDRQR